MAIFTRTLFIFCLVIAGFSAKAVTANFTASTVRGCAPLLVFFTNTSSSDAVRFYWDLGNGTTSTLRDVSGTYVTVGTFTCRLVAYGAAGDSSVRTMVITVIPSPTIVFRATDTTVCPGTPITFTNTTTGGVAGPVTYLWNFGEGGTSTATSPTYTYAAPGFYNVTLVATNAEGCVSSLTKTAYIHVYTPPRPFFSASTVRFCDVPGTTTFTDFTTGAGPYSYLWRFGDGGTSTSASPSHTYTSGGGFDVSLIVTDVNGCVDSTFRSSYIFLGPVTAGFTAPSTACWSTFVRFTNTSSAHSTDSWNFGDGGTSTLSSPTHVFSTPGTYNVRLIVFDGTCYDTVIHPITILPGPAATFTVTPRDPCPPPATLTFTGTVPTGTSVTWFYGDGGTGTGATSSHTYGTWGEFLITMVSVDPTTGCRDTLYRRDTILDLDFSIIDTPTRGCVPLTVRFRTVAYTHSPDTVTRPYPFPIGSYVWNFGDGSSAGSGATPSHTYTAAGTYYASVTGLTSNGCVVMDTVEIHVGTPPVITFTMAPTHICFKDSATFTVTVISGPVDSFYWVYGTSHEYTGPGTELFHTCWFDRIPGFFTVSVTPVHNGCRGTTVVATIPIQVDSPKAIISSFVSCSPYNRVFFGDSSLGDDVHTWYFGDGGSSTADNPIHDYPGPGVYTVMLATLNTVSGCRDTAYTTIDTRRPVLNFTADRVAICKDDTARFTATFSGATITSVAWYSNWRLIGSGSFMTSIWDTFNTRGLFTISMVTVDQNGCIDTVTRPNYLTVAKPIANFTVAPASGCWPLNAVFTDASTFVPGTSFARSDWDFGDGARASVTTLTTAHTYTLGGTYTVIDVVTDNVGCKDTASRPAVTVYRPSATFFASTVTPCTGDPVTFTNSSSGIVSSFWRFGDGDTSSSAAPIHIYSASGVYSVTLRVTDVHGCSDSVTYPSYINVSRPVAGFYMIDSFSVCPPLMVNFFNTSTGASSFYWDLAGGVTSVIPSPSNLYLFTGINPIMLIATNTYGCRDTAYGNVRIFGYAGGFTYTPDTGCAPLRVRFKATVTNVPHITWDFADGTTASLSYVDSVEHLYPYPGAYLPKLILSDNTGCQSSSLATDTIKVDKVYPGFTTNPHPICVNGTVAFVDTSRGFWNPVNSWAWTFHDGTTSSSNSPSFTYAAVGEYPVTLVVTNAWGCTDALTTNVVVNPPAQIDAGPDTVVCVGDAARLTASGGVTYIWSPPATLSCTACNPTFASPTVVTNYTVTGTDDRGCINTDTVSVYLKTKTEATAEGDTAICRGISVRLTSGGGHFYTWIPGTGLSDPTSPKPLAKPDQTTDYMVIAKQGSCEPDTNYVKVIVYQLPTVDAGPSQRLVAGSIAQIDATGTLIQTMTWGNPSTLSCDSCLNPVASMSVTTTYFIDVASPFGCKASDSVTIYIYCDESQIFIPNAFTPNGDGQNDVFYPRGTGVSNIKSFRIYNRWGEQLFIREQIDINDPNNAWDGTYMGDKPRPDVYVYIVEAICQTGEPIFIKGDVTIIR